MHLEIHFLAFDLRQREHTRQELSTQGAPYEHSGSTLVHRKFLFMQTRAILGEDSEKTRGSPLFIVNFYKSPPVSTSREVCSRLWS